MEKTGFIIGGLLLCVFGFAQGLQILGLFGSKTFSIAGLALTVLGLALGLACFQKAFRSK